MIRSLQLGLLLVGVVGATSVSAEKPRPNLLVIFVDDLGWGDVSCYGGAGVPTPCIDRLAAEGIRFTQFYTASPICSASRCGLLTGQFPARWRITSYLQTRAGNRACEQADFLDPQAPSFVRAFHDAGYSTAHIGKWHLGGGRDVSNAPKFAAYGYDVGFGTHESPEPAAPLGLKSVPWSKEIERQQVARHDRTRWMVDATLAFSKAHAAGPWLINLWLDDVHTPFRPSQEQQSQAGDGIGTGEYRAVLRETDRQIGRLLDGLQKQGIDENTLVILAGDNGPEPSFDHKRTNGLRGMKWSLYEGGIRTPFIVRWPAVVPTGVVNESTVIGAVDLFATLCSLARVPPPEGVVFDGEDMSAVFRGDTPLRSKVLFWEYGRSAGTIHDKGARAFPHPNEPQARSPNVAIRDDRWKLLVNADGSGAELYDLAADPYEAHDVSHERTEVLERLMTLALDWRRSLP